MLALRNLVNHFGEHCTAVSDQLLVLFTARIIVQRPKTTAFLKMCSVYITMLLCVAIFDQHCMTLNAIHAARQIARIAAKGVYLAGSLLSLGKCLGGGRPSGMLSSLS